MTIETIESVDQNEATEPRTIGTGTIGLEFCETFTIGNERYVRCFDGEAYRIVPSNIWDDYRENERTKERE